ncbi:SDR family oxidoreductase [Shewanella psychropiezotolerans]|uniref:SDR family oxidoreductase n=1 Tax=Shewanella psychropiezotolerans TaxID=2593655 RepID=A0ABX5X0I4_9GAMM|nr:MULTISPECIES: SDR family oxidoreductase [Shewanella]MPY23929.1 SDR family oxidoreductase [Shewanella sp. YLB-07]QDO84197.1 SDR family oxidoreductase [Shewanella psychropiezotolerans]
MYDFQGKLYLITGATSGLGLATTESIINHGGKVIATGRNVTKLKELEEQYGSCISVVENDSRSPSTGVELAVVVKEHGYLDGLWLNASIDRHDTCDEITEDIYKPVLSVNSRGPILQVVALSKYLKSDASILVSNSSSVYEEAAPTSLYSASKGALLTSIRVWARELGPKGVRVNALFFGSIATSPGSLFPEDAKLEFERVVINQVPLERMATAQEAESAALFLLSNQSSNITGSYIPVDDGLILSQQSI